MVITEAKRTNEVVSCQRHVIKTLLLALFVCPALAQGQSRAVLTGIVRDPGGVPIANVRVTVVDPRRVAVTNEDGKFAMPKLPSGDTLRLYVGRIGYRPTQIALVLVPGSNELSVDLEPIAHQLDAIRTSVEQTGVFGVVGDTAYEVVAGARVHLTAGVLVARVTNELGQFAIDTVKPGANLLEVQKEGFKPRLVSFTQPAKGGTKLAIWMMPLPAGANPQSSDFENRTIAALFDFKSRARYRRMEAIIATREMLAKYGPGMRLSDAIDALPGAVTKGARARDFKVIFVDEMQSPDSTLDSFQADDVELVELYPPGSNAVTDALPYTKRRSYTSLSRMAPAGAGGSEIPAAPFVARIWLRR